MASVIRLPISHSRARHASRLPSMVADDSETSFFFSSSIGAPSSAIRARTAASGTIDLSR